MEPSIDNDTISALSLQMPRPQLPTKTPVSVLQEMCVKCGITPKYDLLQVEGVVHEPTFVYRVTVDNFVSSGQGLSKKKAKHSAAKSVLDRLAQVAKQQQLATPGTDSDASQCVTAECRQLRRLLDVDNTHDSNDNNSGAAGGSNVEADEDENVIDGNPVGELQELCLTRRWPPPVYRLHEQLGLPHQPTFTISCTVGAKYTETGVAKSKRVAKKRASYQMLKRLADTVVPVEPIMLDEDGDEDGVEGVAGSLLWSNQLSRLKGSGCLASSARRGNNLDVAHFHRDLKDYPGELLDRLKNINLDDKLVGEAPRYVQLLQEIAAENNFTITWIDVDEATTTGERQCLVQLSTTPATVCFGGGSDDSAARNDAARNTLKYLQVMMEATQATQAKSVSHTDTNPPACTDT